MRGTCHDPGKRSTSPTVSSFLDETRSNGLTILLGILAILLLASALAGAGGLAGVGSLGREVSAAEQQNFELVQETHQIREEIWALRNNDETLERVARRQAHLVRPGETLYRLRPYDR